MKTLRTLATVLLAAVLVLGPTVAFGATLTMTLATNAPSYAGQATIQVTGTITPAPATSNTAVVVTTSTEAVAQNGAHNRVMTASAFDRESDVRCRITFLSSELPKF